MSAALLYSYSDQGDDCEDRRIRNQQKRGEICGRWMDPMSEVDQVVVLDTGSTDGTVERLRARGPG